MITRSTNIKNKSIHQQKYATVEMFAQKKNAKWHGVGFIQVKMVDLTTGLNSDCRVT